MRKITKIDEKKMKIIFKSADSKRFQQDLEIVKGLAGRSYHPKKKEWYAPINKVNLCILAEAQFEIPSELFTYIKPKKKKKVEITLPKKLEESMKPYQKEGLHFIVANGGKVLLGDEMGLGKTLQAISFIECGKKTTPTLIICPSSLKINWQRELKKWINKESQIINGKTKVSFLSEVVIVNYEILGAHKEEILKHKFKTVVLDECHYIKNPKAQRTKTSIGIIKKLDPYMIPISGTPITSKPAEFFTILNMLRPEIFPTFWEYAKRYCGMTHNGFGYDYSGASNLTELNEILKEDIMIRRKKMDVLKELDPKIRTVIPLKNEKGLKDYYRREAEVMQEIEDGEMIYLSKFEKLKQKAWEIKEKEVITWIKDFLESEEKLIIMATHYHVIDSLYESFKDISVKLDGRSSQEARQQAVDDFQNNPSIKLFVGNIKASGVGITLTASSNVATIQLGWTPGEHDQAEDRAHRIGQKDTVNCWYLLSEGTIEEEIADLLDKKRKILASVLDGKEVVEDSSVLTELIKKYKEKY